MPAVWFGAVLVALVVGIGVVGAATVAVGLEADAPAIALRQLGTLVVLALFVERALEVYVSVWRERDRRRLDRAHRDELEADPPDPGRVAAAARALGDHRAETQRLALLGGLFLGVLIALAGVRVLAEIVTGVPADTPALQRVLLGGIDVLVTGGLIGGGAEALHKLMMVVTSGLDATRRRIEAPPS
jgi:hypothetical protein